MQRHKIPVLIISILSLIMWGSILNQTILGEGYYYFDFQQRIISAGIEPIYFLRFDVLAKLLFEILIPIFHSRIIGYLIFQLVTTVVINICFYLLLESITKNRFISLFSSLIFLSSYAAGYELYAMGNYQRFIQRVPNILLIFVSLYFLHKFLKQQTAKYYYYSLATFFFAIFLAHYNTFLTPLLVIYLVTHELVTSKNMKTILKSILLGIPFVITNIILTFSDPLGSTHLTISDLFKTKILVQILNQLTNTALPIQVTEAFGNLSLMHEGYPYTKSLFLLSIGLVVVFVTGYFYVAKQRKLCAPLYLTFAIYIFVIFFLNVFIMKVDPTTSFGSDRYYYLPMFGVAFIWANILGKKLLVLFTCVFVILNVSLVNKGIYENQYKSEAMNRYLSYIEANAPYTKETVMVMPSSLMWPASLIERLYGEPGMKFIDYYPGWQTQIEGIDKSKVFVVDYDYERHPGEPYNPKAGKLIDRTPQFRNGENFDYIKQ